MARYAYREPDGGRIKTLQRFEDREMLFVTRCGILDETYAFGAIAAFG